MAELICVAKVGNQINCRSYQVTISSVGLVAKFSSDVKSKLLKEMDPPLKIAIRSIIKAKPAASLFAFVLKEEAKACFCYLQVATKGVGSQKKISGFGKPVEHVINQNAVTRPLTGGARLSAPKDPENNTIDKTDALPADWVEVEKSETKREETKSGCFIQ